MVGRLGTLAEVPLDATPLDPSGELPADQGVVDSQAHAPVEVALPVVPPCELPLVGVDVAVGVDEVAGPEDRPEAPGLVGGDVGRPGERGRIPDVAVVASDVEVARHDDPLAGA